MAPLPSPAIPLRTGKETCETTRNGTVRLVPEGPVTVTGITDPTCALASRIVDAPRPISSSPAGRCPVTVENRSPLPRIAVPATAPTATLLIEISVPNPREMAVTAGSCSRLRSRPGAGWPDATSKLSWKGSPYNVGVAVRWERLSPKTAVAHRAVTATAMPMSAVPTGTVARPRPLWRACRTPITALGGAPAPASCPTMAEGRNTPDSSSPSSVLAARAVPARCPKPPRPRRWRTGREGARASRT